MNPVFNAIVIIVLIILLIIAVAKNMLNRGVILALKMYLEDYYELPDEKELRKYVEKAVYKIFNSNEMRKEILKEEKNQKEGEIK